MKIPCGRCLGLAICVAISVSLCGCGPDGPELGSVTGIVTLDGEPVQGAVLTFMPLPGSSIVRPAYATTVEDGRYEAVFSDSKDGVPTGSCKVILSTADVAKWKGTDYEMTELFPKKYHKNYQTIEIVSGDNQFDFHAETEGFKPRTIDSNMR